MKLRVVDWVDYDDDYPESDRGWAARNAVIDDIRKHGYSFSGWAHQEGYRCAPLLNDGTICRYSQRGWGDVMAEANGEMGAMDYVDFAFMMDRSLEKRPDRRPEYFGDPESDLNEAFALEVSADAFESARRDGKIILESYDSLRYLYKGDSLTLSCGGEKAEYIVTDVYRTRDKEEKNEDKFVLNVFLSPAQQDGAKRK